MSGRRNMLRNRSQNRNSHEVHKRPSQDSRLSRSYDRLQNKVHHISPVDSKSRLRHSRDKDSPRHSDFRQKDFSQRHFSSSDGDKDLIHNRTRAFAARCQSDQIEESMRYQDSIHDRTRVFPSSSQSDDINSGSYRQERLNSVEDLEVGERAHHLDNLGHHGKSQNSGRHQDRDEDRHIRADADRKPSLGLRKDNDRVPYPIRDSEQQVRDDSCRDLRHKQREDDRAHNRHAGDDLSTNRHHRIKNDGEIALRSQSGENLDREQLQQHWHEQDQSQHLDSVQDCYRSQHRNSFTAQIIPDEGRVRSQRYLEERERALPSNRREGRDGLLCQSLSPDGRRFREDENKSLMEVRDRAEGFSSGQVTDRERYTKSGYSTASQSFIDFDRMQDSHLNLLNSADISSHQSSQVPVEQMSQEAVSLAIFSALGVTGQANDNRFANALMTSTVSNPRNIGITNHTTINQATSVTTQVPATCPLVSCRATVPFLQEHILISHLPSCFANTSDTSVGTMRQRSIVLHAFAQEFTDSGGLPGLLHMIQSSGLISGAAELELDLIPALQAFSEFLGEPVPEHYTLNPPNACSVLTHWRILLQLLCVGGKDVQERFSSQSEARKLMQSISKKFVAVSFLGPAAGRSVASSHGTGALMPPQSVSFQDLGSGSASDAAGPLKTLGRVPPSSNCGSHFTMSGVKHQSRRNNRIPSTSEVLSITPHDTDSSSTQERHDSGGSGGGKEVYKRKRSPSADHITRISKRYSVEQIQRRLDNCTGDSRHRDLLLDNHEPQNGYGSRYGDRHMSPPSSLQTLPFDRYPSSLLNHPILPEHPHEGRHLSLNNQILPEPCQDYSTSSGDPDKQGNMVNYGDIQIRDRESVQQDALIRMAQRATDDNPEQPDVTVAALSKKRRRARKQIEHKWDQMIKAQQKQMDNAWKDNAGLQAANTVHSDAFGSDGQTGTGNWLYTSQNPGLQQAAYVIVRERSLGHGMDTGIPAAVDCHFYLDVVAITLFTKQGLMRRSVGLDSLQAKCLKPNENLIQLVGAIGVFSNPDHYSLLMGGAQPEEGNTRWYTQDGRLGLSVGFNPKFTRSLTDSLLEHIRQLAKLPSMKAYGDVGLSYSTGDKEFWALQRANLHQLLKIAPSSLPVKLSCRKQTRETAAKAGPRDAYQDLLDIAREELAPVQPIYLVSFNGNVSTVRSWLSLFPNCYFGISPNCIKSAFDARRAIGLIPEDRLLLESSSPSFRLPGYTKNSPLFLGVLAKYVGKFRKLEDDGHILAVTTANARRLFSLA